MGCGRWYMEGEGMADSDTARGSSINGFHTPQAATVEYE